MLITSLGGRRSIRGGPRTEFIPPPTAISISTVFIRTGFLNIDYGTFQLEAINGSGTKVWTITSGTLPDGLSMNSSGQITGTPTVEDVFGPITFKVTDDTGFDEEAYSITITSPSPGDNGYFDDLVALGSSVAFNSNSLRTQPLIDSLALDGYSSYFTYDPVMDAAKYSKNSDDRVGTGSDSSPGGQNLKKLMVVRSTGSVLVTIDFYLGDTWKYSSLKKLFQHWAAPPGTVGVGARDCQFLHNLQDVSVVYPEVATLSFGFDQNDGLAPGMTGSATANISPTGPGAMLKDTTILYADRWSRYWCEFQLSRLGSDSIFEWYRNTPGYLAATIEEKNDFLARTWHAFSAWIADEQRAAIRVMRHVPKPTKALTNRVYFQNFLCEFNTSSLPPAQRYVTGSNAATNGAGTVITLAGADLSDAKAKLDAGYQIRIMLGYSTGTVPRGTTTDPHGGTLLRTVSAINNTTKEVTISGSTYPINLTNQLFAVCGPIYAWVRNWVALQDYDLPETPEDDTFIFRQPNVSV